MSKESAKTTEYTAKAAKIRFWYGIAFGATSALVAFLLVLQVCDIYFSGGRSPYTPAVIKSRFLRVLPVLILWVGMIAGGFLLWRRFPAPEKKGKADPHYLFSCLKKKLADRVLPEGEEAERFQKIERLTVIVKLICGVAAGIAAVFSAAYLFDGSHFNGALPEEQNAEVARAALYLLPFTLVAFALLVGVAVFEGRMIQRQIPLARKLLSVPAAEEELVKKSAFSRLQAKISAFFEERNVLVGVRLAVAAVGIVLLVYGLATGGNDGVLAKAVTICRQCIGLG